MMELNIVGLIVACLATLKLSKDFAYEQGPFGFYAWVRDRVQGYVYDLYTEETDTSMSIEEFRLYWLYDGIACHICISFWLGFIVALLFVPFNLLTYIAVSLALGGFVTLVTGEGEG